MSPESTSKIEILKDRALMLRRVRDFFQKQGVLEVDTPLLSQTAPVDVYIDLITTNCLGKKGYLHSSPEYGMKRLLSLGLGDIYQLSHVFRDGEVGEKHEPEFLMAEWYRIGLSFEKMIEETLSFIRLFLDVEKEEILSYENMWEQYGVKRPKNEIEEDEVFAFELEPKLGVGKLTVINDFPAYRAALSKVEEVGGKKIAKRFEVFYKGYELGNGYLELTDAHEQEKRLLAANEMRKTLGKESYPIDNTFLAALKKGIPPSSGVAVGFDRLMMLRHKAGHIREILPYSWSET